MHPILLVKELRRFITVVTTDFVLSTGKGNDKAPQVLGWGLPTKNSSEEPDYPFVLCRLTTGEDNDNESTVHVKIMIGTHSEDVEGWEDAANVLFRIRDSLLITRTLANKYELNLPLKWELPEEQAYPQWVGWIDSDWIIAQPEQIIEEVDYGYE